MREVRVSANPDGRALGDITADIEAAVATLNIPPGYDILMGGDAEELKDMFANMMQALFLAVVFIYLILATQFGSFTQPFAIMLSLPLSLVGVAVALLLTGDTLNIMSMIGLIMLMGLVTKNAILLVDFANQARREQGLGRNEALIKAGSTRLRPIVMTTLAMIFGMLPLAFALGRGRRDARAHGPRRDRRAHHLDPPHPDRGAGGLHLPRRPPPGGGHRLVPAPTARAGPITRGGASGGPRPHGRVASSPFGRVLDFSAVGGSPVGIAAAFTLCCWR